MKSSKGPVPDLETATQLGPERRSLYASRVLKVLSSEKSNTKKVYVFINSPNYVWLVAIQYESGKVSL